MNAFGRLSDRNEDTRTRPSFSSTVPRYCTIFVLHSYISVLYGTLAVGKRDGLKYSTVLDRTSETTVRLLVVVNTTVL